MKKFFEFSNKIISESCSLNYEGIVKHYDIFSSDQFGIDIKKVEFIPVEFIKLIDKKINFHSYDKETEFLIYDAPLKRSFFINVKPVGTFRHQIVFERFHSSVNSIPHLTKTGQIRIIL